MTLRPIRTLLLALALAGTITQVACTGTEDPGHNYMMLYPPQMTIAAGAESFWCYFGTFEESFGVRGMRVDADSPWLHHALFKQVPDGQPYQDGELVDCETLGDWWGKAPTMFEEIGEWDQEGHDVGEEEGEFETLPEGMAFKVEAGQRYVLDFHYVNTSDEIHETGAEVALDTMEIEEVRVFAGAFNHDGGAFSVAPGLYSVTFDCFWDHEVYLLQLAPHMHDYGSAYSIDLVDANGTALQNLVTVEEWDPEYRDDPPVNFYDEGEFKIEAGHGFRTVCTWDNPFDFNLGFPEEMCTTIGLAYPLEDNIYCEAPDPVP
ncbi:MAG: hypothetical protein VX498_01730 [Myxococcota bacterium]|nr:hypothetical protein [Myxococcota bacterium]